MTLIIINQLLGVSDIEFENKPSIFGHTVDGKTTYPMARKFISNKAVKPMYDDRKFEGYSREFKKPIIGLNLSKRKSFIINPYYSRLNDETGELEFLDFYNEAFDTNMKLATCIKNAK